MSSKRLSDLEVIYPPKKRALYEHMKLNGIEKFSTNQIAINGVVGDQESLDVCGIRLPVHVEIKKSQTFSRPRSDSLQSEISSHSDRTETDTGSTESRETSPCTIQGLFDHHTPERNPITSIDGLKRDISKPLFPAFDCNKSADNERRSVQNILTARCTTDGSEHEIGKENIAPHVGNSIVARRNEKDRNHNSPKRNAITFLEHKEKRRSFQNWNIPNANERENNQENVTSNKLNIKPREVYMGPMVSLINRFNAEAENSNKNSVTREETINEETERTRNKTSHSEQCVKQYRESISLTHSRNTEQNGIQSDSISFSANENNVCKICSRNFTTKAYLLIHMKAHENKSIQCWVCKQEFLTTELLNVHMKIEHKGENPYKCEHCSREFTQYNNLRRHMRVHRENVYKCNLCNREFNEEFYLKMHMGTHTGKRVYSCGVCGEGFPSNHDLKMHVKTHSPSLLHTCNVCGKSFSKACVLRQHKKGHSGERPHKCDKCEKTFIHRHHLTMHLKSHGDEKRLSCNICLKEFSQHSHLYKHLKAHEDEKNAPCVTGEMDAKGRSENKECGTNAAIPNGKFKVKQCLNSVSCSDSLQKVAVDNSVHPALENAYMNSNSKQVKRRRRSTPQQSVSKSGNNVTSASTEEGVPPLPSISQTFGHQLGNHRSNPFVHGLDQNYLSGSPTHPLSVYNPLIGTEVPVSLDGYHHSYSQLYKNYSEHLQVYYKNMYLMNLMSHNAFLPKSQNVFLQDSQNAHVHSSRNAIHQSLNTLHQSQNAIDEKTKSESHHESAGSQDYINRVEGVLPQTKEVFVNLRPKTVNGIENINFNLKIKSSKKADELKDNSIVMENSVGVVHIQPQGDIVIRNTSEREQKTSHFSDTQETAKFKEQEVAQELLKMSAGNDIPDSGIAFHRELNVLGMNYQNCLNNVIDRTVRSSADGIKDTANKRENGIVGTHALKAISTGTPSSTDLRNDSKSLRPKSITLDEENTNGSLLESRKDGWKQKLNVTVDEQMKGIPKHVEGISDQIRSPLEKLRIFVASEKSNFDEEELKNRSSGLTADNTDPGWLNLWSEFERIESVDGKICKKLENEIEGLHEFEKKVDSGKSEVHNVDDTLEERLEKIRKFANIAQKFGRGKVWENGIDRLINKVQEPNNETRESATIVDIEARNSKQDIQKAERAVYKPMNDIIQSINDTTQKLNGISKPITEVDNEVDEMPEPVDQLEESNEKKQTIDNEENNGPIKNQLNDSFEEGTVLLVNDRSGEVENKGIYKVFNDSLEDNNLEVAEIDSVQELENERHLNETGMDQRTIDRDNAAERLVLSETEFLNHVSEALSNDCENESNNQAEKEAAESEGKVVEEIGNEGYLGGKLKNEENLEKIENKEKLVSNIKSNGKVVGQTENDVRLVENDENECLNLKISYSDKERDGRRFAESVESRMNLHGNDDKVLPNDIDEELESDDSPMDLSINSSRRIESDDSEHKKLEYVNKELNNQYLNTCKFCDKSFVGVENLMQHVNGHRGLKKPYVCNVCNRSFSQRHNLNRHKMSHNSKSYECNICHRSFKESFYLQMHMKTHVEENIHSCQICGQKVLKTEIWEHMSQHMGNISENPTYQQISSRVQEILQEKNFNANSKLEFGNRLETISENSYTVSKSKNDSKMREIPYEAKMNFGHSGNGMGKALNLKKDNIENVCVTVDRSIDEFRWRNPNEARNTSVLTERNFV